MKLFQYSDALERVLAIHVDENGEITDDALEMLEALECQRDTKALDIAAYLLGERAEAEAVQAHADRLRDRARVHRHRAEWLERYLAAHVPQGQKLSDARSVISWRKSRAVELDVAPEHLPEKYQRVKVSADRIELKHDLEAGVEIKGARMIERMNLSVK